VVERIINGTMPASGGLTALFIDRLGYGGGLGFGGGYRGPGVY
jgi:hypothetical protein